MRTKLLPILFLLVGCAATDENNFLVLEHRYTEDASDIGAYRTGPHPDPGVVANLSLLDGAAYATLQTARTEGYTSRDLAQLSTALQVLENEMIAKGIKGYANGASASR